MSERARADCGSWVPRRGSAGCVAKGRGRLAFVLPLVFALFTISPLADASGPVSDRCCERHPGDLIVGLGAGLLWARAEEIVESLPAYAAEHLSHLTWSARTQVVDVSVSYRPWEALRLYGRLSHLIDTSGGELENLDYLDRASADVTHRSVSTSEFHGFRWSASVDVMLVESGGGVWFLRGYGRLGYSGTYHSWQARGGEYEYPRARGRFDDDETFVRYVVLHQVVDVGGFVELGHAERGIYGRMGMAVSPLPWVNDRDTHVRRETDYYNTYRRGWYVRPEIAVGVAAGRKAMEVFYEPTFQFEFAETGTRIKAFGGVCAAEERPNLQMVVHRVGLQIVWSIL